MNSASKWIVLSVCLMSLAASQANAQTTPPPSPAFDVTGFIQEATIDGTVAGSAVTPLANTDPRAGGTVTVNGIKMLVPNNTILQMPATSFTWQQMFQAVNSATVPGNVIHQVTGQIMLALGDIPTPRLPPLRLPLLPPFPSFEIHVVGNVLPPLLVGGQPRYVVGLIVPISQQSLNSTQGIINFIDYTTGRFRVGGKIGDPNSGLLVEVNDPVGRFGKPHSPDPRFTSDTNNPTITATTGYPVGIPRVAPPSVDPLCPITNRPRNGNVNFPVDPFLAVGVGPTGTGGAPLRTFDMPAPGSAAAAAAGTDPTKQVPLMVGDYVTVAGTMCKIVDAGPNLAVNMYLSAHTIDASLGIYTAPGTRPAYVNCNVLLLGVNGNALPGLPVETASRIRVEGFTTDPTRFLDIYAIDVNPVTGQEVLRLLGTTDPGTQAIRGRYRFFFQGGLFEPGTREVMVVSRTGIVANVANGLTGGQFRLPNFTFIFPESIIVGSPAVPNNFQDIPFLAQGSGPLNGNGPVIGQLDPWPGDVLPPKAVGTTGVAPVAVAGPNIVVGSLAPVQLVGTVTLDPNSVNPQIRWLQTLGPAVALSNPTTMVPTFSAPTVLVGQPDKVLTFTLTVTDQFGTSTSTLTVTVKAVTDVITITAAPAWKTANAKVEAVITVSPTTAPLPVVTMDLVLVDGTGFKLGPMNAELPTGTFTMTRTSVPKPAIAIFRSSRGGQAVSPVTIVP